MRFFSLLFVKKKLLLFSPTKSLVSVITSSRGVNGSVQIKRDKKENKVECGLAILTPPSASSLYNHFTPFFANRSIRIRTCDMSFSREMLFFSLFFSLLFSRSVYDLIFLWERFFSWTRMNTERCFNMLAEINRLENSRLLFFWPPYPPRWAPVFPLCCCCIFSNGLPAARNQEQGPVDLQYRNIIQAS